MAVTLRYFTEFDKPALQKAIIMQRNLCKSLLYFLVRVAYNVVVMKFTFSMSSPDEFLVKHTDRWRLYNIIRQAIPSIDDPSAKKQFLTSMEQNCLLSLRLLPRVFLYAQSTDRQIYIYIFIYSTIRVSSYKKEEAQLSQRDRAAACLNFGKNISASSVHLTLLYVTALTSTNHHFTVLRHHVCT